MQQNKYKLKGSWISASKDLSLTDCVKKWDSETAIQLKLNAGDEYLKKMDFRKFGLLKWAIPKPVWV